MPIHLCDVEPPEKLLSVGRDVSLSPAKSRGPAQIFEKFQTAGTHLSLLVDSIIKKHVVPKNCEIVMSSYVFNKNKFYDDGIQTSSEKIQKRSS